MALAYYIIDYETTGVSTSLSEVTEVSIIRCSDRMQINKIVKCEHPETAHPEALAITKKTYEDLLKGENKEDVVEYCNNFILQDGLTPEHRCFIAHSAPFDRRFSHAFWDKCNKKFPAHLWMCTKEFTRGLTYINGIVKPKLTLEASLAHAGIKPKLGAHSAIVDTQNTYVLWSKLMESKLDHLNYIKREPHL